MKLYYLTGRQVVELQFRRYASFKHIFKKAYRPLGSSTAWSAEMRYASSARRAADRKVISIPTYVCRSLPAFAGSGSGGECTPKGCTIDARVVGHHPRVSNCSRHKSYSITFDARKLPSPWHGGAKDQKGRQTASTWKTCRPAKDDPDCAHLYCTATVHTQRVQSLAAGSECEVLTAHSQEEVFGSVAASLNSVAAQYRFSTTSA